MHLVKVFVQPPEDPQMRARMILLKRILYTSSYLLKSLTDDCLLAFKIACATAGEAQKWMEAFDHAKQQVPQDV